MSIKYVIKYINKGSDQSMLNVQSIDEVKQYQSGRYICSSKEVWRILSLSIHEKAPTIIHLAVHLENGQRVYFSENNVVMLLIIREIIQRFSNYIQKMNLIKF